MRGKSRCVRLVTGLVLASAATARAQNYAVDWWTVDGGGTMSGAGGTYALGATAGQPDAGGPFVGGTLALHSGFWALAAGGGVGPQADLSITKTNGVSTLVPGQSIAYAIVVRNDGPSAVTSAPVSDPAPSALTGVAWTCTATGGACPPSGSGSIAVGVDLTVGGTATFTMTATVPANAGDGTLVVNSATVSAPAGVVDPDPNDNLAIDIDVVVRRIDGEIAHGTMLRANLMGTFGQDVDLYRLRREPSSSYEVVVDETSGDIGAGSGPSLDLVAADGSTVLWSSVPVGAGSARSLRLQSLTTVPIDDQLVRVRSTSCTTNCGPDDVYRLRMRETTGRIARFNNSGTQVTVLMLQNVTSDTVAGTVLAWAPDGTPAGQHAFTLNPHALLVLPTSSFTAAGSSGTLTIPNDGALGAIAGKTVALEPSSGYSFDSPLQVRPR